jgi:hypothetical protein
MIYKNKKVSKKYIYYSIFFLVLLASSLSLLFFSFHGEIHVGDTKKTVKAVKGEPKVVFDDILSLLMFGGELWVYGPELNLGGIFSGDSVILLRIIGPCEGDEVVLFSYGENAKVVKIGVWKDRKFFEQKKSTVIP